MKSVKKMGLVPVCNNVRSSKIKTECPWIVERVGHGELSSIFYQYT